jgi:Sulfotransferase family
MTASARPAAGARAPAHKRVPDFFIVGQFKSGTTALYQMLRRHPQIFMPEFKELWFFAPELLGRSRSRSRPDTLEGYTSLFDGARPEERVGEATPSYLMSTAAARRIAEVQPDARIIAILREPASFLRSFHLQCMQNRTETESDLRKALALEEARREGKEIPRYSARPHELLYSEHVRYVEMLRRYKAVFPPDQVLVLIYEDFRRDNEATLRRVLRFLDVDDTYRIEPIEANPTVRVRSPRLHELLLSVYLGRSPATRAVKGTVKAFMPRRLRGRALKATQRNVIFGNPRRPDAELTLELRRRFKGEVVALSRYLNRDLVALWGYDGID